MKIMDKIIIGAIFAIAACNFVYLGSQIWKADRQLADCRSVPR